MFHLFRLISLRYLIHDKGRSALTILGVAIGVAVFVSVRLANTSAMASFSDTIDAIAGTSNFQVVGDSEGLDELIFPLIRKIEGVQALAPVIQTYTRAHAGPVIGPDSFGSNDTDLYQKFNETLLVMGIDLLLEAPFTRFLPASDNAYLQGALAFLADSRGVAVTTTLANRYQLDLGDTLTVLSTGRLIPLTIRYIIESEELQHALGGNVVMMDIGVAQEVFQRIGKLDRIDLLVDPKRREETIARIESILPPQASVTQSQNRTQQVENMVSAFALSLTALSSIALFVAMFLIFNAIAMAVLRRRREIGMLRSVGVTRRQVASMILVEALFIGVVGSLLGLGFGTLLTKLTLSSISRTLTTLYLVGHASSLHLDTATYVYGFLLGVFASLLAALAPALEASRTSPVVTVRQGILIEGTALPIARWTMAGSGALLLTALISVWTVEAHNPWGGFLSAFFLLAGFSLLAPVCALGIEQLVARLFRLTANIEGMLGARYLKDAIARISVSVAALMVAVSMVVGMSIMVGSFRETVDLWITQSIRGDLYIQPAGRRGGGATVSIPSDIVEQTRRLEGVAAVDTYRGVRITYNDRIAFVVAIDFDVHRQFGRLQFLDGRPSREVLSEALASHGVLVTESFAYRHRVDTGDLLTVFTPTGEQQLPIAGVFYDYSSDAGTIMMDYHHFETIWQSSRTESMALYLEPEAQNDDVRQRFLSMIDNHLMMHVTPNRELRERALMVFDQTFRITYALQAIAIVVAVLGVITTLTALILQRGREIGIMRAVGALKRQIRKMVLVESGLLGLIGTVMGCACGVALSILLIYVINKQFFGWSIRLFIDPWIFVQVLALMVITALLAGLAPARNAAGRSAADAMRMEG